jgi:hypothetical protein
MKKAALRNFSGLASTPAAGQTRRLEIARGRLPTLRRFCEREDSGNREIVDFWKAFVSLN